MFLSCQKYFNRSNIAYRKAIKMFRGPSKRFASKMKSQDINDDSLISSDLEDESPPLQRDATKMKKSLMSTLVSSRSRKSTSNSERVDNESKIGENMRAIMNLLGIDFEKTIDAKRKKIEQYGDAVIENHQERLSNMIKEKTSVHIKQLKELDNTTSEALTQWEKDTKIYKDQEDRALKFFEQQIILTEHLINQEKKRVLTLRKLQDTFIKTLQEMESNLKKETNTLNAELCEDMNKIKKKIAEKNTKKALANARHSLLMSF